MIHTDIAHVFDTKGYLAAIFYCLSVLKMTIGEAEDNVGYLRSLTSLNHQEGT